MADEISIVVRAEDKFSTTLGNFGNIITGIKSLVDLAAGAFQEFTGFVMEGLNAVGAYEKLTLALTSMNAAQMVQAGVAKDVNAAWDVSVVKAEALADWMQQLAIHSPFTLEGVANAFRLGMAYGFTAEETQRLTQATIDYAAATGSSEYQMERIVRALGQISATGKLTGQDMMQLTQAGLPVAQILAEAFNVSTAEIIKMRSEGLLPAQETIEAITLWIENNFGGAADKFSTSWAGLFSTFQDIKQMGLREFFTGLAEAIQPVAIAFSEWLQGPGMTLAGTFGEMLGVFANDLVQKFGNLAPVMTTINQAILQFTNLINDDWTPLQALVKTLDDLALVWEGTTLGTIAGRLAEFFETGDTEGWGQALKDLFTDVWVIISPEIDKFFALMFSTLEKKVNEWVDGGGPDRVVNTISTSLNTTFQSADFQTGASAAMQSLFDTLLRTVMAIDWFAALQPIDNSFADWSISAPKGLDKWFADLSIETAKGIDLWFANLSIDIGQGLMDALNELDINVNNWVNEKIIIPVKEFLGIASPSTVFFGIGQNIILGLMQGLLSMVNPLMSLITALLAPILFLFQPVLDLLGIGNSGTGGASSSVSGLGTGAGAGTSPLSTANNITNNFYGPVYFGNMEQLGYDCPSPHPLLEASGKSLLTSVTIG